MAGDSLLASEHMFEARSFDPSKALGHLDGLRGRLCPVSLAAVQPIGDVAAIGFGPQDVDLALFILAKGHGLRLIDPEEDRLKALLRRIALEQEYALWAGDMTVPERERQWRAISCSFDIASCKAVDLALWGDRNIAPDAGSGEAPPHLQLGTRGGGTSGGLFLRGRLAELALPEASSLALLQRLARFLQDLGFYSLPLGLGAKTDPVAAQLAAKILDVLMRLRSYGCDQRCLLDALGPIGLPPVLWGDAVPPGDPPMSLSEIRLFYLTELLNFGRNLLGQGSITQLDVLDLVAVHALGQPPETGGPIYQARCYGLCAPLPVRTGRSRKSQPSGRSQKSPKPPDSR